MAKKTKGKITVDTYDKKMSQHSFFELFRRNTKAPCIHLRDHTDRGDNYTVTIQEINVIFFTCASSFNSLIIR